MDSIIRVGVCALKLPLAPPPLCTETASLSEHAFITHRVIMHSHHVHRRRRCRFGYRCSNRGYLGAIGGLERCAQVFERVPGDCGRSNQITNVSWVRTLSPTPNVNRCRWRPFSIDVKTHIYNLRLGICYVITKPHKHTLPYIPFALSSILQPNTCVHNMRLASLKLSEPFACIRQTI